MTFLSTFTPSLMSPETLEAIFVQREELARRLVQDIRSSATTAAKHYHLLIGARGMGKTHLVSLVRHRVARLKGIERKLAVAWLREDEHGVMSYLDLLLRIRDVLAEGRSEHGRRAADGAAPYGGSAAEDAAIREIDAILAGRTLLVIIENFDDILRALGRPGQEKLRAHLQTAGNWTILATAQGLAPAVRDHAAPFYGFFDVDYLEELSFDDSLGLLRALATQAGDAELARLLDTPGGRARVRALRHLAGGNHRVHVIFSRFLTAATLKDIAEPFLRTLDELTPYYQARMAWLSPQQRKIVEAICDARGPIAVRDLANACRITQQVTSGQLKQLRTLGYVNAREVGRESHYELREPLLRLVTDLKKNRGETLRTLVDFLVIWYSLPDLEAHLSEARERGLAFDVASLTVAIARLSEQDEFTDLLHDRLRTAVQQKNPAAWLALAEELSSRSELGAAQQRG